MLPQTGGFWNLHVWRQELKFYVYNLESDLIIINHVLVVLQELIQVFNRIAVLNFLDSFLRMLNSGPSS